MLLNKTLRSSSFKLTLLYVGLLGLALSILFGYLYWSTVGYLWTRFDRAIAEERAQLVETFDRSGRDALIALINKRIAEEHFQHSAYLFADASLASLAGNLASWPPSLLAKSGWSNLDPRANIWNEDRAALRATFETLPDGSHLLVGRDIEGLGETADRLTMALAGAFGLMLVLAVAAGISTTRRSVARIEAINMTSREILRRGLGGRIPLRGSKDEWDQLAENLNSMFERIEALVGDLKRVSDNIAHDLRTPLARMRGRLERAYHRRLDAERYHTLVGETLSDLDAVLGTFSSLLRISQIEVQDRRAAFDIVDLMEVASEVVELFDAAAEENGHRIGLTGAGRALVHGDRDLLFDAISNLLDNAIKHASSGGPITVHVAAEGRGAAISVADHGPGIPPTDRQDVFKRFYRLERSRSSPGNGLGLSLVAAVVQLHGAAIELGDNAPGLQIQVRFPPPEQTTVLAEITNRRRA